jgi:hypothetical protein
VIFIMFVKPVFDVKRYDILIYLNESFGDHLEKLIMSLKYLGNMVAS